MIKNLFSILINQYLTFYELFILSNQNKTKILLFSNNTASYYY